MGVRRGESDEIPLKALGREVIANILRLSGLSQLANIDETFALIAAVPPKAVLGIFARYGKPLAVPMPPVAADDQRALIAVPGGGEASVRVLQVRGYGDASPTTTSCSNATATTP